MKFAEEHAKESWGRWKTPNEIYTNCEVLQLPVCTKSVSSWSRNLLFGLLKRNIALKYNEILLRSFGRIRTVYLIRDAEAVCNGWMRRGCDPYQAGIWYRRIIAIMLSDFSRRPNDILFVQFQDVLIDPLNVARNMYSFLGLEEIDPSYFHLKSKKIIKEDGSHQALKGTAGQMMWIPRSDVGGFLDPGVDTRQREGLSSLEKLTFQRGLGDIKEQLKSVVGRALLGA